MQTDRQAGKQSARALSLKQAAPISETHIGLSLNMINQLHVCVWLDAEEIVFHDVDVFQVTGKKIH